VQVSDAGAVTVLIRGPDVSVLAELMYDHMQHVPSPGHTAIVHTAKISSSLYIYTHVHNITTTITTITNTTTSGFV